MRKICLLLLVIILAAGCTQPGRDGSSPVKTVHPVPLTEPEFKNEFDRLVWLLGGPNFDMRKEAHQKLLAKGSQIILPLEEAAAKTKDEDHRQQIQRLISELKSRTDKKEKKDLLVSLSIGSKEFVKGRPVEAAVEIKNTGNVPLELTVPLLRKRSLIFRLDWTADLSFVSGGKTQVMQASGIKCDEWHRESWNPSTLSVKPGDSLKASVDITDLCIRPARFTAVVTYRWAGVGDFMSNAVTFEIKTPPARKEPGKKDGDN